ncbi:MAG TPA: hypothetical protein VMU93_01770 [Caulobacteraceae bacterium]|nr:hypothetical protein [Caulobacteraceae bacterium]
MSLQSFVHAAEKDLEIWAGDGVHFVEGAAVTAWSFVLPFVQALAPIAWTQAVPIIVQAIEDVGAGSLADLETSVLNKAQALGVTLFQELDAEIVQALVAVVRAFRPRPAPSAG